MVIKDDKVRKSLWDLRFKDGYSPQECVERLTAARVSCQSEVYKTLVQFEAAVSWQYDQHASERVCAGGLTEEQLQQLKRLIDQDADREYSELQNLMLKRYNVRVSSKAISAAVRTSVGEGGLGYSHKLKQFIAGEKDHDQRRDFLNHLDLLLPPHSELWDQVVFLDESHRAVREGCKRKELGPKGVPAGNVERFGPEARQTFTLIAAVNTDGVIEGTPGIFTEGVDSDTFYQWLIFQLCPYLGDYDKGEPNCIVMLGIFCRHARAFCAHPRRLLHGWMVGMSARTRVPGCALTFVPFCHR